MTRSTSGTVPAPTPVASAFGGGASTCCVSGGSATVRLLQREAGAEAAGVAAGLGGVAPGAGGPGTDRHGPVGGVLVAHPQLAAFAQVQPRLARAGRQAHFGVHAPVGRGGGLAHRAAVSTTPGPATASARSGSGRTSPAVGSASWARTAAATSGGRSHGRICLPEQGTGRGSVRTLARTRWCAGRPAVPCWACPHGAQQIRSGPAVAGCTSTRSATAITAPSASSGCPAGPALLGRHRPG